MQLSTQLFVEIVGDQSADSGSSTPSDERRQSPRIAIGRIARVFPLLEAASSDGQPALVKDISVHGIGMLIGEPMSPGDEFVIQLPIVSSTFGDAPLQIQCAVRRCQPGGTGQVQFLVGVTFELVLNRPLGYAVEFPSDVPSDSSADEPREVKWDPFAPSPAEFRFDEQLAESIANLPQRLSIGEFLAQYAIARWFGRLIMRGLSPLVNLLHRLGIRSRLAITPPVARAVLKATEGADAPPEGAEDLPDSSIPFRERSMISALDSASHYTPGIADTLPPPSPPPSTLTDLSSRRPALFARPGKTSAATESVIEAPATTSAASTPPLVAIAPPVAVASDIPTELPPVVPVTPLPEFQLPEVLPSTASVPFESFATPLQLDGLAPAPIKPAISIPPTNASKKPSGAAWRGRHRSTLNESPRHRPKLGR